MDESNYEILNRKNRIYIRRFRHDPTRFECSHVSYMTQEYLKKKGIIQLKWPANSPDLIHCRQ